MIARCRLLVPNWRVVYISLIKTTTPFSLIILVRIWPWPGGWFKSDFAVFYCYQSMVLYFVSYICYYETFIFYIYMHLSIFLKVYFEFFSQHCMLDFIFGWTYYSPGFLIYQWTVLYFDENFLVWIFCSELPKLSSDIIYNICTLWCSMIRGINTSPK